MEDSSCTTTEPAKLKHRKSCQPVYVSVPFHRQSQLTVFSGVKMLVSNLGPEVTDEDLQVLLSFSSSLRF